MAPQAHAPHIKAASLWLNGSNDHHGGHERGCDTFKNFQVDVPQISPSRHGGIITPRNWVIIASSGPEKYVLGKPHWPARPTSKIQLGQDGVTELLLTPANPEQIKKVQIYQCLKTANNIARFWRDGYHPER